LLDIAVGMTAQAHRHHLLVITSVGDEVGGGRRADRGVVDTTG